MMMCSRFFAIALVVTATLLPQASCATDRAVALFESSCTLTLKFPSSDAVSLETAYTIENEVSAFFNSRLIASSGAAGGKNMNTTTSGENDNDDMHTLFPKVTPIQFTVEVADDIMINSIASVTAAVTFLYQAPDKESNGEESQLLSMLLQELNSQVVDPVDRKFSFTSDPTLLQMEFLPMKESSGAILLKVLAPSGYTSTEVGLIVATSFLSVVLVLVSSVLLYITGGWKTCMTKCTNCLFEEVDDDEYDDNKMQIHAISSKNTYRMKSTDVDDNDDDGDNESQSQLTSIPPSSASGILGVVRNRDHPTLGTFPSPGGSDDDDATGSAMYGDSTPISRSNINALPLGITSMRKLPPSYSSPEGEERVGGFSGMFMQRLTRSSGKKK